MIAKTHKLKFVTDGRRPTQPPNPDYPQGIELNFASPAWANTCAVDLPYPAEAVGIHHVQCERCGLSVAVTAASRPDDPRRIILPCFSNALGSGARSAYRGKA